MTRYLPDLSALSGPIYLQIADAFEGDISSGVLPAGEKLPPQRDLAYSMGVTVGTIGRAYALIRERGLVSGEVGRGTYVLDRNKSDASPSGSSKGMSSIGGTRLYEPPLGKLRFDSTAAPDIGQGDTIGTITAELCRDHPVELGSYTRVFPARWMEAGSRWLARNGFVPSPQDVVPCIGVHAAVMSVMAAVTSPGDYVVHEHATYSQIARSGSLIGRRVALVASDDAGVIPEDFERLCTQKHPKLAFLMPTVQNPTLATMPAERRARIAEIARHHNVWLIEDDLYGALAGDQTPLLASFAPERTFLVGGLSKSVAAGVRGGWVACPSQQADRVRIAHKMLTGGMPFILAELCARLVLSGEAEAIGKRTVAEINARLGLARDILAGRDFRSHANIPFIWLSLPEPWLSGTFKMAAFERGILVDDEDEFKPARTDKVFHRVRIGISSPAGREDVAKGLGTLARLLEEGGAGYATFE